MFFNNPRVTECTSTYGRRNQFRRNPPLSRGDGEQSPFPWHALELVSAANRRDATVFISPLVACTVARYGAVTAGRRNSGAACFV